jgi:two-component sensor histidine kinase
VIGNAVHVMRIATGEITDDIPSPESEGKEPAGVALGRKGGKARAKGMTAKRTTIAAIPVYSAGGVPDEGQSLDHDEKDAMRGVKEGISELTSRKEDALEAENSALRELLEQAGLDASRLLAMAGINATEKEAAERLQRLLLEELHHRVKNTLATVMAITSQSLRNATDLEHGREAIAHRLIALGRAHDLLLQTHWTSASLPAIVRAAIEPFDTPGTERFVVQVVAIDVGPTAVLSLAMALNELCTNAVKHGALSNASGHVEITSMLDEGAQRFKLIWEEKGGPIVKEPTRRSFGTRLIENSLARLLHGDARLRFERSGVICEFDFPLASLRAVRPN